MRGLARLKDDRRRRCGAILAGAVAIALALGLEPAGGALAPAAIDLDAFDAMKRVQSLPNGESLAYVEMGDPAGDPVVLVHGYTDSARDWLPLAPYLSAGDRLIIVDLRGHGASSKPECCYARVDFAYDVKLLLDALSIRKADLVGHSLGSLIVQVFAETWPDRTGRVVLISSTGGPRPGAPLAQPLAELRSEVLKLKEPIDPNSPFMIAWWASPTTVDEGFIRRQRQDSARIPLRVWLAVLDQGLDLSSVASELPKLKAPALLIWGAADPIVGEDGRAALREALPAAEVRIFDRLGHSPFWEDPKAVAASINSFLDRSGSGPPR